MMKYKYLYFIPYEYQNNNPFSQGKGTIIIGRKCKVNSIDDVNSIVNTIKEGVICDKVFITNIILLKKYWFSRRSNNDI